MADSSVVVQVTPHMQALAGGDMTGLVGLRTVSERSLTAIMGSNLKAFGWANPPADVIEDLVCEALLFLAERAGAWDPTQGTTPWGWARHQLRAMASAYIGQYGPDLDSIEVAIPVGDPSYPDLDPLDVLEALAVGNRVCEELRAELEESVRERDARVWLEFEMEQSSGNASPAVTVAELYGVTPDNVRKIVQRVRGRVELPSMVLA